MKHNPDDRRDNVDRIQNNIDHTIQNIEAAEFMINLTDDPQKKKQMQDKNDKRKDALDSMRNEIQDEARAKKSNNK